jgi:hypothetical protein
MLCRAPENNERRRGAADRLPAYMYEFYDVQDVETLAARIEGIIIRTIGLTYTTL